MKYNFDKLANRKNTNSVKYDEFISSLPMWVADMDFSLAPKIKEAIQKDLDVACIGYSLIPDSFYQAFIDFYRDRYEVNYLKEEMVYVSGVVASIDALLRLLCKEGDKVVMLTPIYHTFHHCIENNKCVINASPMVYENGNYHIDWVDLEKRLKDERSKIFLLCNPHNPMGIIFNEEELKRISDLANKYHVLVVSDEIHGPITNPGKKYVPYYKVGEGDFVICMATSKAFNLAGLQSAVIVCKNKELRERLEKKFGEDDIGEPNYFAVNANIASLRDSRDWLDEMNEYVYHNKINFINYIKENIRGLNPLMSDATYMLWVDISKYTLDSVTFAKALNEQTGLLVSPGRQFGIDGNGFFRINLATSYENVMEAASRLKKFIEDNY